MANRAIINNTTLHVGDTVGVYYKLIEKEKVTGRAKREVKIKVRERIQVFEGIVISIKGERERKSFTVRKIATGGIGVERIFPLVSPWIQKITVKRHAKVRRAKLYYLRDLIGKRAFRLKERKISKTKLPKEKEKKKEKKIQKTSDKGKVDKIELDKKEARSNETKQNREEKKKSSKSSTSQTTK